MLMKLQVCNMSNNRIVLIVKIEEFCIKHGRNECKL